MTELATIHHWPELERPVLVVAMEGWVDAGLAAATATANLLGAMPNELVATFDADELIDFRARRPTLRIVNGVDTELRWSAIRLHRRDQPHRPHRADPDRARSPTCAGTTSSPRWCSWPPASRSNWSSGWAPFPAPVPHTRPVRLVGTSTEAELAAQVGFLPATIEVPSGVQGALEFAFGEARIPAVGLWARVPHYASAMPYPAAAAALLDGLARMADLELDTSALHAAAASTHQQIEQLIAGSEEHAALVRQLEAQQDQRGGLGRRPRSATCPPGTSWPPSSSASSAASTLTPPVRATGSSLARQPARPTTPGRASVRRSATTATTARQITSGRDRDVKSSSTTGRGQQRPADRCPGPAWPRRPCGSNPVHSTAILEVDDGPVEPVGPPAHPHPVLPLGRRQPEAVPEAVHAPLPVVGARVVAAIRSARTAPDRRQAPATRARGVPSTSACSRPRVTIRRRKPRRTTGPAPGSGDSVAARSNSVRSAVVTGMPSRRVTSPGPRRWRWAVTPARRPAGRARSPRANPLRRADQAGPRARRRSGATATAPSPAASTAARAADCQVGCDPAQPVDTVPDPGEPPPVDHPANLTSVNARAGRAARCHQPVLAPAQRSSIGYDRHGPSMPEGCDTTDCVQ